MKYRFFVFVGVIFGMASAVPLHAQVTCTASAPQQVVVGLQFTFTFSLNQRPQQITYLQFPNFEALGGPYESTYRSTINGQTTQSFSYAYTLRATKAGNFNIPSATFVVNNQNVNSNAVNIQVVANQNTQQQQQQRSQGGTAAQAFNKDDYFIKATVSNSNPYVGEQVIVSYKLYLSAQTYQYQYQISSRPAVQGFWTYDLSSKDGKPAQKEEIIDGKKFIAVDMYALAVYPQKSGKLNISPMETNLLVQVPVQQQRRGNDIFDFFFSDPFGRTQIQNMELNLSSNSVSIQAKELPETNKPLFFSGLVGDFKLSAKLSRNKLAANDATNLTVTVSGSGNLQYIEALDFEFPTDIAVHDPEIRDNISTSPTGVSGSRTFEYVLIPRVEGNYTIPSASFSYFDKRKNTYTTLNTPEFKIEVEKGQSSNAVAVNANMKTDIKILGTDIRHIKTNWKPELYKASFFLSPLYWVLLILPILLLVIFMILNRKRIELKKNTVLLRDKKASKTARKRLRKAEKLLQNKQNEEFYIEISKVLWGYISDKFHIPIGLLSLDTAYQKLSERNMQQDSIKEFINTLNDCEYVRFAPSPDITPEKMYERTFNFITKIEQELKR